MCVLSARRDPRLPLLAAERVVDLDSVVTLPERWRSLVAVERAAFKDREPICHARIAPQGTRREQRDPRHWRIALAWRVFVSSNAPPSAGSP